MIPALGVIGVIAAASITGFVTWWIAKHNTSGSIETSTADTLWKASNDLRNDLAAERTDLKKEVVDLKEELHQLKDQLTESTAATVSLNREIRMSRDETANAREETRLSREETVKLMAQIASLHTDTRDVLDGVASLHTETQVVLDEVKTSNALSIGALADNIESRRILDIPFAERTDQEKEHLATAKDRLPQNLRAKQHGEDNEDEKNGEVA